jgi:protein-S-isoprenylcysteine O-methyltransferase Ste14
MMLLILSAAFLISGAYRSKARAGGDVIKRQEEGWPVLILRMVLALPLAASLLLNIFLPEVLFWAKISLPLWLQIVGATIALCCVLFLWWVFRAIGDNISETILIKDSHELVTTGPYRWVQHPLYSGALLLIFSFSLVFEDWFILLYSVAGLLVFRFLVIPAEEEELLTAFGEEYKQYQGRTGKMFPKL